MADRVPEGGLQVSEWNAPEVGWCGVYPRWRIDPEGGDVEIELPDEYRSRLVWLSENDVRAMLADLEARRG